MKKVILFVFLMLFLTSCNTYIAKNVYQQTYPDITVKEEVMQDVYCYLDKYEVDSIPMEQWITNILINNATESKIEQRYIIKPVEKDSRYTFIVTTYIYPGRIYYDFLIRYSGKKKYIIE